MVKCKRKRGAQLNAYLTILRNYIETIVPRSGKWYLTLPAQVQLRRVIIFVHLAHYTVQLRYVRFTVLRGCRSWDKEGLSRENSILGNNTMPVDRAAKRTPSVSEPIFIAFFYLVCFRVHRSPASSINSRSASCAIVSRRTSTFFRRSITGKGLLVSSIDRKSTRSPPVVLRADTIGKHV